MTTKYILCESCHELNRIKSMATDRVELEKEMGENFQLNCSDCGKNQSIHINQVKAKPNKYITLLGVILGIALTVLFWNFGFIAFASFGIPILILRSQQKSSATFNSYKIN